MSVTEIPDDLVAIASGFVTISGLATNISGEVRTACGDTLRTGAPVIATANSGGQVLGSGDVKRVIINVPYQACSGDSSYWGYSGEAIQGVLIGGRSGTGFEPYTGSGCLTSSMGLWLKAGDQKEICVTRLEEIHVCGEPSGTICTYLGEVVTY